MDNVFSACFDMLNVVNNYLRNIGSALHHAMKHGKASDFTISILLENYGKVSKNIFLTHPVVLIVLLCVST